MYKLISTINLVCILFMFSCKENKNTTSLTDPNTDEDKQIVIEKKATKKIIGIANISGKSNSETTGIVTFTQIDNKVTMIAQLDNIKDAGPHAIHIHAKGDCSSEDGKSAGGHWNPTNTKHGKWQSDAFHIGDIGNIEINENGNGTISKTTDLWCISCGDPNKDIVGKAIIIHKGPDDFSSQPAGAAGPRIGCGEITLQ